MPPNVRYPGVNIEEQASTRQIAATPTTVAAFLGATIRGAVNRPVRVTSFLQFEQSFGSLATGLELGYAVRQFFTGGGSEAWIVRIAKKPNQRQIEAGLAALDRVDIFNLVVLPGLTSPEILSLAAAMCQKRQAFLLVDSPPSAKTPAEIEGILPSLAFPEKSYAALYYPWLQISDPLNAGRTRLAPPSGTVAGVIARMDNNRGVWKAPAGTEAQLSDVVGLERELNDTENARLNALGINCLRKLPGVGFVVWGARTLAGGDERQSDYKYVPVRRLALFIEASVDRGTRWVTFEPNDQSLWLKLSTEIEAFLQSLFLQRALQGRTPREAFFVKCGSETTTPAELGAGVLNVMIGFAPLKPAEFVVIRLQLRTAPRV